jgi:DNA-binding CsgD family transcriptional regulator
MAEDRLEAGTRDAEIGVSALLTAAAVGPSGLVVSGEAGIGKSTLWQAAREEADARGFRVLSARGAPGEVRLTYAALADLLADVDDDVVGRLSSLPRAALDRILLGGNDGPASDERAAAVAFQRVVAELASETPVLVAIDDLQWVDASSAAAVRFAARRLTGAVGILVTVRTGEPTSVDATSWLQLPQPSDVTHVRMGALGLGALHGLIAERLGSVPPRPVMLRILEISGGNPLYALELARAVGRGRSVEQQLPDSLAALVRARVHGIGDETRRMLLAAASTPTPTVDLVAAATDTSAVRVAELLETGDAGNVVAIVGNRIRFAHPLLVTGVHSGATAAERRAMHRRLAACVEVPELRARHLASAAVSADPATLAALDSAAESARTRGAPAAAAELAELALTLGGDTHLRRIRAAEHHFRAGAPGRALDLLEPSIEALPAGVTRCLALLLLGAVRGYDDDLGGAVLALTQAAEEAEGDTELRLHCLLRVTPAMVMIGRADKAVEYAGAAVTLADKLDKPALRSRALSVWVAAGFVHGLGVDRPALRSALAMEDPSDDATTWYRASAVQAMISAWTGDLHTAHAQMLAVHRRMLDDGTEIDAIWAANHLATIDVWLGRYADAAQASRDGVERAEQMGGRLLLVTAWGWQAEVAAYLGYAEEARTAADAAIAAALDCGAPYLAAAPRSTLAFLAVSLGEYRTAMTAVEPLLAAFDPGHHTERVTGGWLPDAIEALVGLDRVEEADLLVKALRDNGTRADRPWMLAMAARGRAHCLASRGDLPGAERAAREAIAHHDRLPMPFETARTQLLLGSLLRRRRRRGDAAAMLTEAMAAFEALGTPLWAERARAELDRLRGTRARPSSGLTPGERLVAERAAKGLSNKEIAADQFLSIKTVETRLTSAYRKLGIRSRTQLHARLGDADPDE